jgi:hypothetical protein
MIDVVHPGGEILAWHKDAFVRIQGIQEVMTITLGPMKRAVPLGIKKPDDHKTGVLVIIRLFGGSHCGPTARYVVWL